MSQVDGPYSPLKVFHHRDRIDRLVRGEPIVPTQIQLFISDLCNHDCGFCAYRMSGYDTNQLFSEIKDDGTVVRNPNRQLSLSKAFEIIDDCKEMGVKAIQFTGGGEPTAHADHITIFQRALRQKLEIGLVTNGSKLTDQLCEQLSSPGVRWVRISVDAGNSLTYSQVRNISEDAYGRMIEGVRRLRKKKRYPSVPHSDPVIGIGFVVTADNWQEVVEATKTARDAGADNIRISAVFQSENERYFTDFHQQAAELCRQAKSLQTPSFRVFNLFGDRIDDLKQRSPDYIFCGYQFFNTLIGADLNVYRCCVTAYNSRGLLGSLKKKRFKDFWYSAPVQERLFELDARRCPRCMFNRVNESINYAMSTDPQHVNFV
jgi:MoaA/NifB/PqqE/SkfB family radical SAM enzyme